MPDIFDEVEEDIRAERARTLGRRYAGLVGGLLVLILAGTGGYVVWQQQRTEAANAVADRFINAARQADHALTPAGADDKVAIASAEGALAGIAASGPEGYRVVALLRLAALQWQTGQHRQAIADWQALSDDAGAPALLRDLATLTSAEHQVDAGDPVLLRQRLEGLTAETNPWRPMAQLVLAVLDLRGGKAAAAAATLRRLTGEPMVPNGVREMAVDLLTTLPEEAAAPAAPKSPSPAAMAPAATAPGNAGQARSHG